jgi:hypothetical protein
VVAATCLSLSKERGENNSIIVGDANFYRGAIVAKNLAFPWPLLSGCCSAKTRKIWTIEEHSQCVLSLCVEEYCSLQLKVTCVWGFVLSLSVCLEARPDTPDKTGKDQTIPDKKR